MNRIFDELEKEIKKLERGVYLHIPLRADEEGFIDRECPSENCLFQFKVHCEDWKKLSDEKCACCPLCGHKAPLTHWWTKQQLAHAKEEAINVARGSISEALRKTASNFNRNQPRTGFIRMSMETHGLKGKRAMIPIPSTESFELQIKCEKCGSRFAVIGSAFFCPCCGYSSVIRMFDDALKKVQVKIETVPLLKKIYGEQGKRDEGEMVARSLIETCLADCVVAFQRFSEQHYISIPNAKNIRMNVFQNIDEGNTLWKTTIGKGYEDWLSAKEMEELKTIFQRRHLLAHLDGIVDQRYLDKSGDTSYTLGQRIVTRESEVFCLVSIIKKLAEGIKEAVPNEE